MGEKIIDQFTHLPISRQRKYQMRMQRDGRCTECGAPVIEGSRCLEHLVKSRERQREARGTRRRYLNTLGYRLTLLDQGRKAASSSMPAKKASRRRGASEFAQ
jgi:hypothetical protein